MIDDDEIPPPTEDDFVPVVRLPQLSESSVITDDGIMLPPPDPDGAIEVAAEVPEDNAESAILGAILLENATILDCVREGLLATDFEHDSRRVVYAAMLDLSEATQPIDIITLGEKLKAMGNLRVAGGANLIAFYDAFVPDLSHIASYMRIVKEASARRAIANLGREASMLALDPRRPVEGVLDRVMATALAISDRRTTSGPVATAEAIHGVFKRIETRFESRQSITGMPTGIEEFDRMTLGLQRQQMYVVAGIASSGKTSLVAQWAYEIGATDPVLIASAETSTEVMHWRAIANRSGVDLTRIMNGQLWDTDWPKMTKASVHMQRSHVFIDDEARSLLAIRSSARLVVARSKRRLGMLMIDYLQLLTPPQASTREQEIAGLSRGIKAMAKEFDCPVVVISALNRGWSKRDGGRPTRADLKDSAQIEFDADLIAFVHRPEQHDKDNSGWHGIAEIIIDKQKNGPTGTVLASFDAPSTRFANFTGQRPSDDAPQTRRRDWT